MSQKNMELVLDEYLIPGTSGNRLIAEYYKHKSLCIGFDFDGTVHDYHKKGATYHQVIKLLRDLKEIGCILICWTAYPTHDYVIKYLEENDIPFDGVNTDGIKLPWETRKPFFSALLDDRAGLIQVFNELTELVKTVKLDKYDRSECG
jgi:hydroxymethylpyrimidine pyrophosphatase-like HAD family hydrolase